MSPSSVTARCGTQPVRGGQCRWEVKPASALQQHGAKTLSSVKKHWLSFLIAKWIASLLVGRVAKVQKPHVSCWLKRFLFSLCFSEGLVIALG